MKKFKLPLISALPKRFIKVEKRFRFVISAVVLTLAILSSTFFFFEKSYLFIPVLIALAYFFTYFSVLEGIEKVEWFTLFFMPVLLTVSFYLFYFLMPGRWLTRLPFIAIYGISVYAVMLCSNIFNVGVEKNLQLYRAAFSVNFFYQTLVGFILFNLIFSFKQNFFINGIIVGIFGFLLSLHLFWTIRLKNSHFEREIILFSLLVGFVLMELAIVLSFVPVKSTIFALFITGSYYGASGLIYNYIDERLFKETVREYLIVWGFVFVITLLSISW
jgi:hypothetical protein